MSSAVSQLTELRERANSEHAQVVTAAAGMIAHAIAAGQALNGARELVPWGEWMQWVEREFAGSVSNANFYRRLALNEKLVNGSGARTLREAERYLVEHAEITTPVPRTGEIVKQRRQEILSLRQKGKPVEEVAAIVGVSVPTVYNLARKDWQRQNRRHNLTRRQATQALKREQRDKQARKIGGDVAEAYAMVRRTAQILERALEQADGKQEREHLGRALARLYKSEDEISRAMRAAAEATNGRKR